MFRGDCKIAVLIPCYNESRTIKKVVPQFPTLIVCGVVMIDNLPLKRMLGAF